MEIKIVESSLNLRVEKRLGKVNNDYTLSSEVAEKQLALSADIFCNVEYMECNDVGYMKAFSEAGYIPYKGLDENRRGILCMVRKEYAVRVVNMFDDPHMLHIQVEKQGKRINIITVRILISSSNDIDFIDRKKQWDRVLEYMETLEDRENLIITGDFNHGVINSSGYYSADQARRYYNYQMVVESLDRKNIKVTPIEGTSYRGYMKIDHLCISNKLRVIEAEYRNVFGNQRKIGVPDHSFLVARVEV